MKIKDVKVGHILYSKPAECFGGTLHVKVTALRPDSRAFTGVVVHTDNLRNSIHTLGYITSGWIADAFEPVGDIYIDLIEAIDKLEYEKTI